MRRASNGKGGGGGRRGGAGEGEAGPRRVEQLRRSFVRFRREHPSGTRIPDSLRKAALTAIDSGASEAEVRRACSVTSDQLGQWRNCQQRRGGSGGQQLPVVDPDPRIFAVVDDEGLVGVGGGPENPRDLEVRLGGWSICIRQVEG